MAKKKLTPSELKAKKQALLAKHTFATKKQLEQLDRRLQMQVEGLPFVDFDYDYEDGDLVMEYVDGNSIIEDNIDFADGDLIITPTAEI